MESYYCLRNGVLANSDLHAAFKAEPEKYEHSGHQTPSMAVIKRLPHSRKQWGLSGLVGSTGKHHSLAAWHPTGLTWNLPLSPDLFVIINTAISRLALQGFMQRAT